MKRDQIVVLAGVAFAVLMALFLQLESAPTTPSAPVLPSSSAPAAPQALPAMLTAAQEHAREMKLLGLKALRPAVPPSSGAAGQDLALPDPLKLDNGKRVLTSDDWWRIRRQEIADKVELEIFGQLPNVAALLNWQGRAPVDDTMNGVAVSVREIFAQLAAPAMRDLALEVRMKVILPAKATVPVPLMLLLAKKGEDSTAFRDSVLARGWGVAILELDSIQSESGDALMRGIIGVSTGGQPRAKQDWGVLRAWAWGASRAYEFFETEAKIDPARVGIAGYGRAAKAALIAAAYDPRYAIAYIASPGAAATSPIRLSGAQSLVTVDSFQYFGANLLKYASSLSAKDLPVDTHDLFALAAPHPIFIGIGSKEDDPKGMILAMAAADPVYKIIGKESGLGTSTLPAPGTLIATGALAFRQQKDAEGTGDANLPYFLTFAERYLAKKL